MSIKDKSEYNKNNNLILNKKNVIISLLLISIAGFIIRISFVSFEIPITLDGLSYFWYAIDMSQSGYFPIGYPGITNNGWPSFLSIFFSLYNSDNFLDFMALQRLVSITISVLTVIPIYLLCRQFVSNYFAIFGAALFVFEPRIIQNSTLGITEPLIIMLLSFSIFLFLKNKINFTYIAFAIASVTILIRVEAIFIFLALSIGFFWKHKKNRTHLLKYLICIGILALILLPMISIRLDTIGNDGILSRIFYASDTLSQNAINRGIESGNTGQLIILGFENFIKFLGWSMIPTFLIFVPYGYLLMVRKRNFERSFIIMSSIVMILPIIYALSVASDTRYLFTLYPFFCIASAISFEKFSNKIGNKKIFIIIVLSLVLATSITYLDYKKVDVEHEKEALNIAKIVSTKTEKINLYPPESQYLAISEFYKIEKFPLIRSDLSVPYESSQYGWPILKNLDSTDEAIKYLRENNITHLVIDNNEIKLGPLADAYFHEEKYPYLEKIFDSKDEGYTYHVKIFKIHYELVQNSMEKQ